MKHKRAEIKAEHYGTSDFQTLEYPFSNIFEISAPYLSFKKSFCTPDGAMVLTFQVNDVPAF